jgi:hypothetical protein
MKNKNIVVWLATGKSDNGISNFFRFITNPVTLIIFTVISTAIIIYCGLNLWVIPFFTTSLAIVSVLIKRRSENKPLISEKQTRKCNDFNGVIGWFGNRYNNENTQAVKSNYDVEASTKFFCKLGRNLVELGIYEETGKIKTNVISGNEFSQIELVTFHVAFNTDSGIGFVLLEPSISLISKTNLVNEKVVSHTLREVGLIGWTVQQISEDNDSIILYALKNEDVSHAYNFSEGA